MTTLQTEMLANVAPAQKNRRTAIHDRRGYFIQVQWDRRAGADRRVRNLQEELKLYQRFRDASEMAVAKYKWAIQTRALAPATVLRYTRYIFQNIDNIHKYDGEIQRINESIKAKNIDFADK
jgi:hypothetical protein